MAKELFSTLEKFLSSFNAEFTKLLNHELVKFDYNKKIAIAISGGVDSISLASLVSQAIDSSMISALIVDHGLRNESSEEAVGVKNYLEEKFNIESVILKWQNSSKYSSNIQHHAREARYKLMLNYCASNNIHYICTGHNADDQVETVILNILRGSGIDGISGIPAIYTRDNIVILRPLLSFFRQSIASFAKFINLKWVEDPSNTSAKYDRNRVRHFINNQEDLLDSVDLIKNRVITLSNNAKRTKSFLYGALYDYAKAICYVSRFGNIILDYFGLLKLHDEMALRLLRYILQYVSGEEYCPRLVSLESLWSELRGDFKNKTLSKCEIIKKLYRKNEHKIVFIKESRFVSRETIVAAKGSKTLWDNRFWIYSNVKDITINPYSESLCDSTIVRNYIKNDITNKMETLCFYKVQRAIPAINNAYYTNITALSKASNKILKGSCKRNYNINRPLSKLATDSKMLGDLGAQNRNVSNIREDSSTTAVCSTEVELRKRSNEDLSMQLKQYPEIEFENDLDQEINKADVVICYKHDFYNAILNMSKYY